LDLIKISSLQYIANYIPDIPNPNERSKIGESWGRSLVYKFLMPRFIGDTGYWLNGLRPTFKEWFIGFD